MRFGISFCFGGAAALLLTAGLLAQGDADGEVQALRAAKARAARAEQRAEFLRQEASSAEQASDRMVAQRAAMGAEIDAANAQIAAARVRVRLIAHRQKAQAARLGEANEPLLRLNALLQRMTRQPTLLLFARPGNRRDYVHVRAAIASIEPVIAARTAALRGQMAAQRELRAQEQTAMKALTEAKQSLGQRSASLASLEASGDGTLSGEAALEYERAIGQGERARELVEEINATRESSQNAALLGDLDGPVLASRPKGRTAAGKPAYILPARGAVLSGLGELNPTGYRERGIRMRVGPSQRLSASADGTITYAGRYGSYGNIVIIDHGNGWTTLIAFVEQLGVEKGSTVRQGAFVGTARADNPEIMIELRRNGRLMDIGAMVG
jgi:septal ring factor EnvC (AmiA/AmiB activator)